jgi:murein DD-endopeptidase MepM/ murein hydrolase activator NlpD
MIMDRKEFDGLAVVAVAFIIFIIIVVLRDEGVIKAAYATGIESGNQSSSLNSPQGDALPVMTQPQATPSVESSDPNIVVAPYDHYFVTQGPHGFNYGHMAIDISGGKGAVITSPINGVVTESYVDQYGNTTLVIENSHFRVTFLHGLYTVKVGDQLIVGQTIGTESNQGLTYDPLGRLCQGRDCGYHTHLNFYDKQIGSNVNPLDLIGK